ncbi:MAG: hypothetical protein MK212_14315 [Saprospiraceae bacterium]|nr:hypothetical protein [Saprospiraceae bacterium]
MVPFFLLILYTTIFYFGVLKRLSFFQVNGLPPIFIFFIFCTKLVVGISYGLIYQNYFNGGDTFLYFKDSQLIHNTFLQYPDYYIASLLGLDPDIPNDRVFTYPSSHLFWKDLGTYVFIHICAFIHIFTFGYYSLHIFWIALLSLIGNIYFYRFVWDRVTFPPLLLVVILFFTPSILFWTSGLHKEVFIYLGLGWLLYGLKKFENHSNSFRFIFFGLLTIGLFRSYLLGICLPFLISFFMIKNQKTFVFAKFLTWSTCLILIGFGISSIVFENGLLGVFSQKQAEFLAEKGNSDLTTTPINIASLWEILLELPKVLFHTTIQPLLWECKNIWQYLASFEAIGIFSFGIFTLFKQRFKKFEWNRSLYFILFYTLSNLVVIGLLVDNTGAIVRYRSIPFHMFTLLFVHYTYQQTTNTLQNKHGDPISP